MYKGENGLALPYIEEPHSIDMLFKVSIQYEGGKSILLETGDCGGIEGKLLLESFSQIKGKNHIADSYSGGQGL